MRSAIPAHRRPARNALTVAANCVNRTRKHAASVTAYSVLRACPSIQCSTPKLHQQTTGNVEKEKGHRAKYESLIRLTVSISETCRQSRDDLWLLNIARLMA